MIFTMNKHLINLLISTIIMSSCSFKSGSNDKVTDTEKADSLTMILGSYSTSGEEGIKVYTFNQDDAGFSYKSGITGISNPSFISDIYRDSLIYSVAEDEGNTSSACALKFDKDKYKLSLLNSQPTGGGAPCNIAVCPDRNKVFTANYMGGNLSVFDIDDSGKLKFNKTFDFIGTGPVKDRQEQAHIHSVNFTPDGTQLWANDLGSDKIRVIDMESMTHDEKNDIQLPLGSGPRHTCYHSNGKYAYIITELSGDVLVLNIKEENKTELIQTIKADTIGAQGSADIHLSPDEKFLYASCRLQSDGIAIFRVSPETGLLERIGYCLTGKHPRNFAITPNGKYVLVACRDNNSVEIYSRDTETGLLSYTGKKIETKAPVCVRWVR